MALGNSTEQIEHLEVIQRIFGTIIEKMKARSARRYILCTFE